MNLSTFYQTSIYICLCVIAVNLSFAFITGLGVFGTTAYEGMEIGDTTAEIVEDYTGLNATTEGGNEYTGMDALWVIAAGSAIGGIAGFFLSWATKTSVFMAIGLFSGVFWSSYLNSLSVINAGGYLDSILGFILIGTVLMVFVFAGAVIGMLGGSG